MTRNAVPSRSVYSGNNAVAAYAVANNGETIVYRSESDIIVWERSSAGVVSQLVQDGAHGYTMSGTPIDGGVSGLATRTDGNLPTGAMWAIQRQSQVSQETNFQLTADWNSSRAILTDTVDRMTEIMQEIDDKANRALKMDVFDLAFDASSQQIKNLAEGTDPTDAVTFHQMTSIGIDKTFDFTALDLMPQVDMDTANDLLLIYDVSADTTKAATLDSIGYVFGPLTATDNALMRYDGATGTIAQNSGILISDTNALTPATSDAGALGTTALQWSDVFLASGGVINFANGDVTLTHASNLLTFAGASSGYRFDAVASPTANDGAALGSTSLKWSDLFLASGAVINFNSGDATITHSADLLTFASASNGYRFDAAVAPTTSDGAALGSASLPWSDIFLASGAVLNFANGDATLTHSADKLSFGGAASGYWFDNTVYLDSGFQLALITGTDPQISVDSGDAIRFSRANDQFYFYIGSSIEAIIHSGGIAPGTNDGGALGTSSLGWSDVFLASGAVLNFNNSNVTLTHSAGKLTLDSTLAIVSATPNMVLTDTDTNVTHQLSGNSGVGYLFLNVDTTSAMTSPGFVVGIKGTNYTITEAGAFSPYADDVAALGTTSKRWSDLFLASGAVLNIASGDWAATHSTGVLTVGTGDLRVTTAGTNSASVVTVGGTQTLTNKTLTSPTINTPTLTVADGSLSITGSSDATKVLKFEVDGFTTATTRTITVPNITDTMVTLTATQTLTNKSIAHTQLTGLGTGVATWMATPSSANLAAAITDETGSGLLVFATSPTLSGTPLAPTAANGTNTQQIATTAFVLATRLDQLTAPTTAVAMNSQKITGLADPTNAQDAATKAYVDTVAQGLDAKASVRVATTATGTLASAFANGQTVDGITLVTGDRILLKNQSSGAENGIYTVNASGAPTRAVDMDAWTEVPGAFVFVEVGTTNGNSGWTCTSDAGGTLGTTAMTWVQFSGAGTYTASTGLTLTGTAFSIDSTVTTLTGAQTLTNKSLTSPTITGSPTATGATWADLGTVTTIDINGGTLDAVVIGGSSAAAATVTTLTVNTNANPDANDGAGLGTSSLGWSDLFLASGAVINFNNGDVTLTHSSNQLTIAGLGAYTVGSTGGLQVDSDIASTGGAIYALGGSIPTSTSVAGVYFGKENANANRAIQIVTGFTQGYIDFAATSEDFSVRLIATMSDDSFAIDAAGGVSVSADLTVGDDLFFASGAVINFNSSDVTITHSSNTLTIAGGTLVTAASTIVGTLDAQQAILLSGDITPTQITADTDDYAPTGFATATVLRLSTDANHNLTGLAGGADGRTVILRNVGSFDIVLPDSSASSSAANRFKLGADFTLGGGKSIVLVYDGTDSVWYPAVTPGAGGGGGGGGAPDTAQYITAVSEADLLAERVATDTTTITWDFGTGGQAQANFTNTFTAALLPSTDDGAAIGSTSKKVSDLFLASGAVVNFNAGDVTLTHSSDTLTLAGGTLVLPATGLQVGSSNPFSDSAGTLTLQNVDALDATTESTIEAAIDTLANLTSIQGRAFTFGVYAPTLLNTASEAAFKAAVNLEIGVDVLAYDAAVVKSDTTATITTGYTITSNNLGNSGTGTVTPDPATRGLQHYSNTGAHTLAPSSNAGSVVVDITNSGTAGAITTSGFTKVSGDAFDTTNGHVWRCFITIGNGGSHLHRQKMF